MSRVTTWARSWPWLVQANTAGLGLLFWLLPYNSLVRPWLGASDNDTLAWCALWVAVCACLFGWDRLRSDRESAAALR